MALTRRSIVASAAGLAMPLRAFAQGGVPFELSFGKVFVPAMVNGRPVQAMLDSGSSFDVLDEAFAREAGIDATGRRITGRGVQGTVAGRETELSSLSVGGRRLSGRKAVVIDYGSLSATVGRRIDMGLGVRLFLDFVVELDFDARRFALHERASFRPPAGASSVAVRLFQGRPLVRLELPGRLGLEALVDTGSDSPLIVSPGMARPAMTGRGSTVPLGGIGGGGLARISTVPWIRLAGQELTDVPVTTPRRSLGVQANLGLEALSRFNLFCDFGGGRLWLKPRNDRRPFRRDLFGVYGEPAGETAIRITHVAQGSPAAAAGFRRGETITAFNGEPAGEANLALRDAPEGAVLRVGVAGGAERTVTLARYY